MSDEVGAALAGFFAGGQGPTHASLTRVLARSGFGAAAPYSSTDSLLQPSKSSRIRDAISAAVREPQRSRELVDGLIGELRVRRCFEHCDEPEEERQRALTVASSKAAFARIDWELTDDGELRPSGINAVQSAEGRPAIEDQLKRLKRASHDPALLLGTAKEMLESTAKYVMEAYSVPYRTGSSFDEIWHLARDRLNLLPQQVDMSQAGAEQVREILQASWSIARMTNEVRNSDGTGHGRVLSTAMSPEMAMLVVREACSIAELVLSRLDRATSH